MKFWLAQFRIAPSDSLIFLLVKNAVVCSGILNQDYLFGLEFCVEKEQTKIVKDDNKISMMFYIKWSWEFDNIISCWGHDPPVSFSMLRYLPDIVFIVVSLCWGLCSVKRDNYSDSGTTVHLQGINVPGPPSPALSSCSRARTPCRPPWPPPWRQRRCWWGEAGGEEAQLVHWLESGQRCHWKIKNHVKMTAEPSCPPLTSW